MNSHASIVEETENLDRTRMANKRNRDQSLTPKRPKFIKRFQDHTQDLNIVIPEISACLVSASSTDRLVPDPVDIPNVTHGSSFVLSQTGKAFEKEMEKFSGSVSSVSPPPSSLPLPKFFMRSQLNCRVEVTDIDSGATENLRRLLRL